jgi:hypothetical protein
MAFTNLATKLMLNDMQVNAGPLGSGFPYLKFAWQVELALAGNNANGLDSTGPLVAKSCELPRFSVETQVVNVYNHKTIVQTKMNYEPITMTFYDQTNNVAESLIWQFVMGQFDSPDVSKKPGLLPLDVKISMKNLSGDTDSTDKVYTLTNAFITDAQHDTLDYSTSDPIVWTITLRYEDLEISGVKDLDAAGGFKGPRKGDNGSGIPALPKPPSKSSVTAVPITRPPKADAKVESDAWVTAGGTVTGGGAATGNPYMTNQTRLGNANITPGSLRDRAARANAERASGGKPMETTQWPQSNTPANNAAFDNNAADPESQTFVKPYNSSTGTPVTKIQSSATAQETAAARAAYAKTDPRRIGSEGINPAYKEAYASEYAAEMSTYDTSKLSPSGKASVERVVAQVASMKAKVVAPQYSAQVRTQNTDGSVTDRYVPLSVNNNPAAVNSQANKEQQYVKKNSKPTNY